MKLSVVYEVTTPVPTPSLHTVALHQRSEGLKQRKAYVLIDNKPLYLLTDHCQVAAGGIAFLAFA